MSSNTGKVISHRFCVAPMMEWTDRHCRFFHRILTRRAMLYTEMVTAAAVIHGDRQRLIGFDPAEGPLGLQLGGSDPHDLARAARYGEAFGYDEINLNCGCPSDRVQSGRFGACLMADPGLVARCFSAMQDAVSLPVTVKCRIAIDDQDEDEALDRFVADIAAAGCRTFIVHARKAWLQGLSPKQNRDVPPLNYDRVRRLKADWPELEIVINGGIGDLDAAEVHLDRVDGAMIGRAAYQNPWLLADVDRRLFGVPNPVASRTQAVEAYMAYVERMLARGVALPAMTRHVLGLFNGLPGARAFRRRISETAHRPGAGVEVLMRAVEPVTEPALTEAA
jgi:tRNA-dihydrouridine synthase A